MKPVILDLDEKMINNLLIVAKPKKIEQQQEKEERIKTSCKCFRFRLFKV